MSGQAKLYTPQLLARAVELAHFPLSEHLSLKAEARSATCGSRLVLGVECDEHGRIKSVGVQAQACAVGQAAASLFAASATGMTQQDIAQSGAALRNWLSAEDAPAPDWPGIDLLAPARAFPARHGAILLAWDAALSALSNRHVGG